MNTKCWYNTTISTAGALRSNLTLPLLTKATLLELELTDIISDSWLNYTKSLGFEFTQALVFFKPANYKNVLAHTDMYSPTEIGEVAFNFTILGGSSEMCWYETPVDYNGILLCSTPNSPYLAYEINKLTLIEKAVIPKKTLAIVNTFLPHSINVFETSRWSVSLRGDNQIASWKDTISYARDKGVLIE